MEEWSLRASLFKYWDRLNSSFWFLPSLMAMGAVTLSFVTVALDQSVTERWLRSLDWAYAGGAVGASAVLQTIAGSMITIAGVVFSLTLVALSLASSQFGPRLLRNFMRDTTNQLVLGTFIATFLYCLLVLLRIRYANEGVFVPRLSVTLGVVFALASLWVLIYFIHHVSVSVQADEIIARVGNELFDGIDRLFPEQIGAAREGREVEKNINENQIELADSSLPAEFERDARIVCARGDGYLQMIDASALLAIATDRNLVLRVEHHPGNYILLGSPLVLAWPAERCGDDLDGAINALFVLGYQRTAGQDVEFVIEQLVEVAARALSPGINDPFTAIACVDRLGSALRRLAGRRMPAVARHDAEGALRVLGPTTSFAAFTDVAFNQIRQYARANAAVTLRLLETIAAVAEATTRREDRAALQRHADMIIRGARIGLDEEEDRLAVEARYLNASQRLAAPLTVVGRDA